MKNKNFDIEKALDPIRELMKENPCDYDVRDCEENYDCSKCSVVYNRILYNLSIYTANCSEEYDCIDIVSPDEQECVHRRVSQLISNYGLTC